MTPEELKLPSRFKEFQPHQRAFIQDAAMEFLSGKQSVLGDLPVGSGKSPSGYGLANLMRDADETVRRVAIVTKDKLLQNQYDKEFGKPNGEPLSPFTMMDIRGKSNYDCVEYKHGTCETHRKYCKNMNSQDYKLIGRCPYRAAMSAAQCSSTVLTNYQFLFYGREKLEEIQPIDMFVYDEAHVIEDELTRHLTVTLDNEFWKQMKFLTEEASFNGLDEWVEWGGELLSKLEEAIENKEAKADEYWEISQSLWRLANLVNGENWVHSYSKYAKAWLFEPVWVGKYSKRYLIGESKYQLFMSGTLSERMYKYWGLKQENVYYYKQPWLFDWVNSPIYLIKGAQMTSKALNADPSIWNVWAAKNDQIMEERLALGRKGLILTKSFDQAREYLQRSKFGHDPRILTNMEWNGRTLTKDQMIERHEKTKGPTVMVTPSCWTGLNLADDLGRWCIIAKIPFPDTREGVMKARMERDRSYGTEIACIGFRQGAGRVVRGQDDWGEIFCTDSSLEWVKGSGHMDSELVRRIEVRTTIPKPMRS